MQQKIAFLRILISLYLVNTYAFGQLQLSVSTDKQNYNYGESITIECSVKNLSDTISVIWASNMSSCQAEFSFNNYNSWEHTACLTATERIEIKPGNSRVYKWTIDPRKYGLPNKDGEQKIVGYFLGGLKDSITINAPKYYGGQLSVGFFNSLEAEINLLKDTLNVEVLSRSDLGSLGISEIWQIVGSSIDSLIEKYTTDERFRYVERSVYTAYDSIYTDSPLSYYPLHVGDVWYYNVKRMEYSSLWMPTETNYSFTKEVTKDAIMRNGKTYFEIKETRTDTLLEKYTYERIDSTNGKIFLFDESFADSNEYLIEFLDMGTNEAFKTWEKYGNEYWEGNTTFYENVALQIFENGEVVLDSKRYESNSYEWKEYYLSKGIGKSCQYGGIIDGYDETFILIAAKINNKIYGDSTLVGIEKSIKILPTNFNLSQNYPNPFNPTTTIQYTIPVMDANFASTTNVMLKVYNVLGKEISTLVNQQQKSGSYEVVFDASNLSSGVYYYQLKSGDFVETKKMIILK